MVKGQAKGNGEDKSGAMVQVDALLERKTAPATSDLPSPEERKRLRSAYGLTQAEVAATFGVTRAAVGAWEHGRAAPRGEIRVQYAYLLNEIKRRLADREGTPDDQH
jgi:DNA-binding transcriptional regulator YiaG